jgi:hypothetical protein
MTRAAYGHQIEPIGPRLRAERDLYAARNGELHVLCHELLTELERLGFDDVHKYRAKLHDVPQLRPDFPMRRDY